MGRSKEFIKNANMLSNKWTFAHGQRNNNKRSYLINEPGGMVTQTATHWLSNIYTGVFHKACFNHRNWLYFIKTTLECWIQFNRTRWVYVCPAL